jgi:hypothetical protein
MLNVKDFSGTLYEFNVHHKVKSTGFSRSALAETMSLCKGEASWSTATAAIGFSD